MAKQYYQSSGDSKILKFRIGKYRYPVTLTQQPDSDTIYLTFNYNPELIKEVKVMEGARWHPNRKQWSIKASLRNHFQISYLTEQNPYAPYDCPLIVWNPDWETKGINFYEHQKESICHVLTRHYCFLAEEMGVGKSLSIIKAMEIAYDDPTIKCRSFLWISSKGALYSTELELRKWKSIINQSNGLTLLTYEGMVKMMKSWEPGHKSPQFVIFDEAHKIKNPTSQRGQAARYLGQCVRQEWGDKGFIVDMTGTPSPRDPCDWWNPCEVVCPGFIREGDIVKFKKRLAIIEQRESITGQVYPHLIGWRDNENKCNKCGKLKDDPCHNPEMEMFGSSFHSFESCINEVALLAKRLKGLVLVKFKKECLSLPDLQYKIIRLKPTQSILNSAEIIKAKAESAIKTLILLRELSDGFQYVEEAVPGQTEVCPSCNGSMLIDHWVYIGPEGEGIDVYINKEHEKEFPEYSCQEYARSKINNATQNYQDFPQWFKYERVDCTQCKGKGTIPLVQRTTKYVNSPKISALQNILEEHEEVGRCVVYAGFTGSIDNIIENVKKWGWQWIRVDGRGWVSSLSWLKADLKLRPPDMLEWFQKQGANYEQFIDKPIVYVGHPDSAGEGVTLTASPTIVYYSNCFDWKARAQSKARIHRPGMDVNRGATIIDLFHLPADQYVYDNLEKKKDLESLSLGVMKEELQLIDGEYLRQV